MRSDFRLSAAVFAGLAWLFVANLFSDLLAAHTLTLVWMVPPLVVFALRLPLRAALTCLGIVALLHDATLAIPFGLTASIALPVAAVLHRLRRHFNPGSRRQAAAVAFALTPTLHIVTVLTLAATGKPLPADAHGVALEIALGTLASACATPWLADLTDAMLALFGAPDAASEHAA